MASVDVKHHVYLLGPCQLESRFGLAVRHQASKQKDLGSIPLRLSSLFRKAVVCGHGLVPLSLTIMTQYNGSHRCPSSCSSQSGGDSVTIYVHLLRINPRGRREPKIWDLLCQLVVFL